MYLIYFSYAVEFVFSPGHDTSSNVHCPGSYGFASLASLNFNNFSRFLVKQSMQHLNVFPNHPIPSYITSLLLFYRRIIPDHRAVQPLPRMSRGQRIRMSALAQVVLILVNDE